MQSITWCSYFCLVCIVLKASPKRKIEISKVNLFVFKLASCFKIYVTITSNNEIHLIYQISYLKCFIVRSPNHISSLTTDLNLGFKFVGKRGFFSKKYIGFGRAYIMRHSSKGILPLQPPRGTLVSHGR